MERGEKMATKKRRKRRYTRLIDLVCNLVLLVICLFTIYKLYNLQMLPTTWILLGAGALLILFLIFFVLMFMNLPSWGIILKRTILLALCAVVAFAGYSMSNVTAAVEKVSVKETSATIELRLLVPKDSDIKDISGLENKTIGIQIGTDLANGTFGKQQIEKKLQQKPAYLEKLSYTDLVAAMYVTGEIDAMLISSDYVDMLEASTKDFKGSYQVISTFERTRPVNTSNNKDITKESFTLLISGVDEVGAADQTHLSDVNILLFINPLSNRITMISLPRDSLMPHAAMNYQSDKLTHTGSYGIDNTVDTIENFFDIDIDYYAKVSFTSLIEIVDAIGGVDVDVEVAFTEQDENRSFDDADLITLDAGLQNLNGKQALAYARHRKSYEDGVAGRERAQEKIIKAIIDKLLTPEGVTLYVNKLMEVVPKYVVTNMPGTQITSFIKGELESIKPWGIQSLTIENGLYDTRLVPNIATPVDVYLWNKYDYRHIIDAYNESKINNNFDDFNFDLDDMSKYLPVVNYDQRIIWDSMAINPH